MLSSSGLKNVNENYGRGTVTLSGSAESELEQEEQRLRTWLDGYLKKPTVDLPRLPTVAMDILTLSRKPNARIEDMSALLEREPLLAGKVLKLANSPLYCAASPCSTLKQALVRMGLELVRDAVMEAAFHMTVLHLPGFNETLEQVRKHSIAVAYLARFVARNTPIDAENSFLAGLLHDVGTSLALLGLSEFLKAEKQPLTLTPTRWLAVEHVHESFSERVLASWGMPPGLNFVAGHHHQLLFSGQVHPSIAILFVASSLAEEHGWGVTPKLEVSEDDIASTGSMELVRADEVDTALSALELTRKHYETIRKDTARVLETLASTLK